MEFVVRGGIINGAGVRNSGVTDSREKGSKGRVIRLRDGEVLKGIMKYEGMRRKNSGEVECITVDVPNTICVDYCSNGGIVEKGIKRRGRQEEKGSSYSQGAGCSVTSGASSIELILWWILDKYFLPRTSSYTGAYSTQEYRATWCKPWLSGKTYIK